MPDHSFACDISAKYLIRDRILRPFAAFVSGDSLMVIGIKFLTDRSNRFNSHLAQDIVDLFADQPYALIELLKRVAFFPRQDPI